MYAGWSRQLNRRIWAALGDGWAAAVVAITNIRTVRAFGAEEVERRKFSDSIEEGRHNSLVDARAGAGTFALTNYLDLVMTHIASIHSL